jgi:hypothetical protein
MLGILPKTLACLTQSKRLASFHTCSSLATEISADRTTINQEDNSTTKGLPKQGGFAEAISKLEGHESFAKMLRKSPVVQVFTVYII